jgi:hypothetical protein
MARGVRKSITIPGLLAPTVKRRCAEFRHSIFTPYAVELVCYDLRSDAKHSITLDIARDTQTAQDAVDRELIARYRPGQPRKGLLVQLVDRIHHLQSEELRGRMKAWVSRLRAEFARSSATAWNECCASCISPTFSMWRVSAWVRLFGHGRSFS